MSEVSSCDICSPSKCKQKPPAVFYCVEDKQHLCLNCATIHHRFNTASRHLMQCLLPQNTQVPCLHQNEQGFYCQTHKALCCEQCRTDSHGNCKDSVITTEEFLGQEQNLQSKCAEVLRRLKKMKNEFEVSRCCAMEREKKGIKRMQTALEKMNKAKEELEEKIDMKVEYMKAIVKRRREYIEQRKNDLHCAITDITGMKKGLCESGDSGAEHIAKIAALKDGLNKYEGLLRAESDESHMAFLKVVEHDFEAEHYVSASLQNFEETVISLNKIYVKVQKYIFSTQTGEVLDAAGTNEPIVEETAVKSQYPTRADRVRSQSEQQTVVTDIQGTRPRTQSESVFEEMYADPRHKAEDSQSGASKASSDLERFKKYSTKSLEEYKQVLEKKESDSVPSIPVQSKCEMTIRVESDETACGITGIAKLDDGYLLMADYENSKLKLFAPCGDFKAQLNCDEKPRDMAKADSNKFLVNFPMAKKLHFVTVETDTSTNERKILLGKKIETNAKCCGITLNGDKIYVATQIPHQILIMNADGAIKKTIIGNGMFERATYISVDPASSHIYISDPNKKVVLGITEDEEEKFRYKVERPHGIACANDGMLFVADWNWEIGTIHLVDKDGVQVGTLNVENCYCPQKLVFCPGNNTLLVTQWQKDVLTTIYLGDKTFTHSN